jgi:hypothetical protein
MDPLASVDDVAVYFGPMTSDEEVRAEAILSKASALFRRIARRDFTAGETTVRLKVAGGEVYLEQIPATAVTDVLADDGTDIVNELAGQRLTVTRNGCPLASHEFVTVTYTYGAFIPDDVRQTIAEIAAKVLRIPAAAAAGMASQTRSAGPFSESDTYAGWAVGGATSLAPEDRALAESYRYRGTQVIVQQP